ncbi:hypothetical protein NP233_g38 [Leucocoprinus birnbaumii]|uniref:Serine-threonine/tyrosine-protein kinase catalytic domain-containing protein n=1 Tax=Leucocoprinus birnbaumii TaxID=56174 RepID=A0AAD5W4W3_9AGAR|nr:hypothetical protein NP233_g38 [Leucocoprinus birnbaumii]
MLDDALPTAKMTLKQAPFKPDEESVLVSNDGKAVITDLHSPNSLPVAIQHPSLLLMRALNRPRRPMFGHSLVYRMRFARILASVIGWLTSMSKVFAGNVPYSHIAIEFKLSAAVATGSKPSRPGRGGTKGNEIDDAIWQLMLTCWEFEPEDRPRCLTIQQIIRGMINENVCHSAPITMAIPFGVIEGFAVNLEEMKARLVQVLGSEHLPSFRVPEYLRNLVTAFVSDIARFRATVSAASKLDLTRIMISDEDRAVIAFSSSEHLYSTDSASSVFEARFKPLKLRNRWDAGVARDSVCFPDYAYYQYFRDIQLSAALCRKEHPKRPVSSSCTGDDEDSDALVLDDVDEDWDELNGG